MRKVVTYGKTGTAMMGFQSLLSEVEVDAVIYFVQQAFILQQTENTRYHTEENGWFEHERYQAAFPFVTGDIALDTPWELLSPEQVAGKQLYLNSCISCHDRAKVKEEGNIWQSYPLSWPRNGYSHQTPDAVSAASPYALHDAEDSYQVKNAIEAQGQQIFQRNCAFCHAADGTGKNWVGQFIQPHPRNFTRVPLAESYTKASLMTAIQNGVEDSAMPAWRYVLSEDEIAAVVEYMWQKFNP